MPCILAKAQERDISGALVHRGRAVGESASGSGHKRYLGEIYKQKHSHQKCSLLSHYANVPTFLNNIPLF